MEFQVNEQGCRALSIELLRNLRDLVALNEAFKDHDGMLRSALGEDYDAIAQSANIVTNELSNAYQELNAILQDMNEYIARVTAAKTVLH